MKPNRIDSQVILDEYVDVRAQSVRLCSPLNPEDYNLQGMEDTSPPKWHLGHTTWFFEEFLLKPYLKDYKEFHPSLQRIFNSYYQTVGIPFTRKHRGMLTRPSLDVVMEYRSVVDQEVARLLSDIHGRDTKILEILETGIHHEKQHQELLLMDIKYSFSLNPLFPAYDTKPRMIYPAADELGWLEVPPGVYKCGSTSDDLFYFDNETPSHRTYINHVELSNRLVTNREYLAFIESGGYQSFDLWLSDGWNLITSENIQAPRYWIKSDHSRSEFTLHGLQELDLNAPVSHLTYYEADAFARWAGARLPSEHEWEIAASLHGGSIPMDHSEAKRSLNNWYYELWQWTQSSYQPYPGFKPNPGALGEYNGKFMVDQYVLRGGCKASPSNHIRKSYRNFFPSHSCWMFSGIRLAKDIS